MCANDAMWSVPDFGSAIVRDRIVRLIRAGGTRPCLVFGSSGAGKSVAAAQYACSQTGRTVWIDASGSSADADQVVRAILRALDRMPQSIEPFQDAATPCNVDLTDAVCRHIASSGGGGILVVVDDLGFPKHAAELHGLSVLARALRRMSSQLLITTRFESEWPADALCDFTLIGPDSLRLTPAEAFLLLSSSREDPDQSEADELRTACSGHLAFFNLLTSQSTLGESGNGSGRTPSLDAWLERIVVTQLSIAEQSALVAATLLRSGTTRDLVAMGIGSAANRLERIAGALPLLTMKHTAGGEVSFRVHDLVDGFCQDHFNGQLDATDEGIHNTAVRLLTCRGDLARASEILIRGVSEERIGDWLLAHGEAMLAIGLYLQLRRAIEAMPVALLMGKPRLLLLWADLCCETGELEDALAKARAAKGLAEHSGDIPTALRSVASAAFFLRRLGRLDEADQMAQVLLSRPQRAETTSYLAEAHFCIGHNRMVRGDVAGAKRPLEEALRILDAGPVDGRVRAAVNQALALVPALADGDFASTARHLSPMIDEESHLLSARLIIKGNVAICLSEMGRLDRCEVLVRGVLTAAEANGLHSLVGAFLPALGCIRAAQGETATGTDLLRAAVAESYSAGDQTGADQSRVYLAVVLRAAGHFDESLCEAERAFERLSVADSMNFRRLAALEVAASLLALGDLAAARSWVGTVIDEGFSGNLYHSLRADMILAEADRLDGRGEDAVARLRAHADYVISENPNWQIAMYCRAFPALIGLFALAVGVERLPSHLLRMILPEHAERCLGATHALLDSSMWRQLGVRLLGEEEFAGYVHRDGLPLCHVRLFGGLDINVGGRNVRERDWKKRKARLLFAMLVIRRGQDVARDQLFEHLWPEMEEERAKNNLYVVWSAMKSVLMGAGGHSGKCPYVESVGGVCRSVRETVRTDVDDFQTAIAAARDAGAANNRVDALRAYERIADLYRGDLLPGDCYDDWFANLREHYRSEFVDAMLRGTQLLMDADDPGNALIFARRAIQCDPFREDLYQAALRCQIAAGQRSSAIDTYLQCRDKLADELGLDPSVETRALYDDILAMEDRPRPTPIDPFVG